MQPALLRVLQDREFKHVGGTRSIRANVRVIVATNRNLKQAIQEGRFREDLFFRVNVLLPVSGRRLAVIPVFSVLRSRLRPPLPQPCRLQ